MPGLLALHAHPDDESISTGGVLAAAVDAGNAVTVVTATGGEAGEIHNREDSAAVRDRLGEIRAAELAAALEVLGVADHEFLGYRDSGMMGTVDNDHPDSLWQADFDEAVGRLVRILRLRRPDVLVAYDPFGGYGHPDHIQVHRIGTAAYWAAADTGRYPNAEFGEPWAPSKLYWATWSRRAMVELRREISDGAAAEPDSGSRDELITTRIDVGEWFERKRRALLAHDSQFAADSWVRTLPEDMLRRAIGTESFTLAHTTVACDPAAPDLFAGI